MRRQVGLIKIRHIVEMGLSNDLIPMRLVYMSEDMQFRLYPLHSFSQSLAANADAGVYRLADGVTDAVRRLMGDQDVQFLW